MILLGSKLSGVGEQRLVRFGQSYNGISPLLLLTQIAERQSERLDAIAAHNDIGQLDILILSGFQFLVHIAQGKVVARILQALRLGLEFLNSLEKSFETVDIHHNSNDASSAGRLGLCAFPARTNLQFAQHSGYLHACHSFLGIDAHRFILLRFYSRELIIQFVQLISNLTAGLQRLGHTLGTHRATHFGYYEGTFIVLRDIEEEGISNRVGLCPHSLIGLQRAFTLPLVALDILIDELNSPSSFTRLKCDTGHILVCEFLTGGDCIKLLATDFLCQRCCRDDNHHCT